MLVAVIGVAIIVAAVLIYNASMAAFTAQTQSSGSFSTGSLELTDDDFAGSGFELTDLTPGDTGTGTVKVTYTSPNFDADVNLYADPDSVVNENGLAEKVNLTITESKGSTTWSGTLAEFQAAGDFASGVLPVVMVDGDTVDYTVTYTMADDAPEASTASVEFIWEAVTQPAS